jgi:type I restriction enzyme S subunit
MNYKRIGDYIRLVDERNKDLLFTNLLGINITKNFMPSVANTSETDLSKYKIIRKGQFAYSAMQVGRDETIRLALYSEETPSIISPAYIVIAVNDINSFLPEYMMMWFQRPESDRFGWFISDSSVRASLEWERFCEIKMPIPEIEVQRKFVSLYDGLLSNQKAYINSLDDLQLICDTYIESLIKTEALSVLGDFIEQSDERNSHMQCENLLGISVNKIFIETKSKKEKLDLSNYKVVRPREFGYVSVTSRNGEKLSIAILEGDVGLVSSTYVVFRVKDVGILLPEYLYLWFNRSEFDRYARYNSWGSARETFDWSEMCNVHLPIPNIEAQEAIVTIYHVLEARKRINEQLTKTINPLCSVLMKGVIDDITKEASIQS